MKNILTDESKEYVVVKINAQGEPEGILTHKVSRYGSSSMVSPFNIYNLSEAVRGTIQTCQLALDQFIQNKVKYKYSDFKIVEMSTTTIVKFGKEVEVNDSKQKILNNNKRLKELAKEWGKTWRKENPTEPKTIWTKIPSGTSWDTNPKARTYYEQQLKALNWECYTDYSYEAESKAYSTFLNNIKEVY